MYGMTIRPKSFVLVDGAVPVLTTGTLSTTGDVMFPNPAYGNDRFAYDEEQDMGWDNAEQPILGWFHYGGIRQ